MRIVNENTPEQNEQYAQDIFEAANAPKTDTPPPFAQDFTNNPFDESSPIDVTPKEPTGMDKARARLKIVHEKIKSSSVPLDSGKLKLAEDGSEIASNVINGLLGVLMSLLGEEYTILTPSKEKTYAVVYPVSRIVMRHSKLAGEISPDYVDASQALKAAADIVREMSSGIRRIRWMKRNGYEFAGFEPERPEQGAANGPSPASTVPTAEPGWQYQPTAAEQLNELGGVAYQPGATYAQEGYSGRATNGRNDPAAVPNGVPVSSPLGTVVNLGDGHLSPDDRRKHDALVELTRRDIQSRRRRAGFLR
jgi:hypothetical protein